MSHLDMMEALNEWFNGRGNDEQVERLRKFLIEIRWYNLDPKDLAIQILKFMRN